MMAARVLILRHHPACEVPQQSPCWKLLHARWTGGQVQNAAQPPAAASGLHLAAAAQWSCWVGITHACLARKGCAVLAAQLQIALQLLLDMAQLDACAQAAK